MIGLLFRVRICYTFFMKYIFIINPTAGKINRSKQLSEELTRVFETHGLLEDLIIHISEAVGEITTYTKTMAQTHTTRLRFYACGGDGTLSEIVNGAYGHPHCAVGVLPIGTGNDFIKSLKGYEREDFLDIERQIFAREEVIDLMRIGNIVSINLISTGLDSAIAKNVNKFKNLPLINGQSAYNLSLAYCFFTSLDNHFSYKVDGEIFPNDTYIFAVIANAQYYGGGYHAAPQADIQDGLLDFICVKRVSRWKALKLVNIYKHGEHLDIPDIVIFRRCKEMELIANEPLTMNIDGEIANMENPKITIDQKALMFLMPQAKDTL